MKVWTKTIPKVWTACLLMWTNQELTQVFCMTGCLLLTTINQYIMKKLLLLWIVLLSFSAYSQKEINREWATQVNTVFEHLDKSKVPNGILLDYAMEFY